VGKPVTGQTVFASQNPPWNLLSLDANFTLLLAALNDLITYSNYVVDTSPTANTITVTTAAGLTFAYTAGVELHIKVAVTNTSQTVNINVNALGNKQVKKPDGTNPAIGAFVAGGIYPFQYDGTNFQILGG
jgi:hypothetical protein